jgi:predicted hotdog family 3-hydroxylacyl-ACP dehydratase
MPARLPIELLIPQRDPFVLVDDFVPEEGAHFRVPAGHILVEDGHLSAAGLVEHIAQTAAARAGYLGRLENEPIPVGYIGAVQDLDVFELPAVGDQLRTTVEVVHQIFHVTQVRGRVTCGGKTLAECTMKIVII